MQLDNYTEIHMFTITNMRYDLGLLPYLMFDCLDIAF